MLDFGYYNMDCMEGMKQFPDGYFDLAIVDPPYGDGGGTWQNGTRFGQRFDRYIKEASPAKNIGGGEALLFRSEKEVQHLPEPAGLGQRSSEKNHSVGRRAGKRILRRTFPRLTKSDHMGGQLLRIASKPLFSDMA